MNLPYRTIQLTIPQLVHIFEQLGYSGTQFAPNVKVYVQLESFQLASSTITIPNAEINIQSPTVESIISSTTPNQKSRINKNFIHNMANQLEISEQELINVIQDPNSGNIVKLTRYLNDIFNDMITPYFTEKEVHEMVMITLPFSK